MIPGLDLAGQSVLIAGAPWAARRAVASYTAAGAKVAEIHTNSEFSNRTGIDPTIRLVITIDDGASSWAKLRAAARHAGILQLSEPAAAREGKIILVGGGPGSADLLTVRGTHALAMADVVFHDRLGPGQDLAELAPGAQLVDVGKAPGHHKVPQAQIQEGMIKAARTGATVVRLKGGDPYVFGRGSEEREAALNAGINVEVIPGISSAISVPGVSGIPVTARGVSKSFTVVSGHDPFTETELSHLAGMGGTVVVLMGVATLQQTAAGLLRHGLAPTTPAAVIERGFTDSQRSTRATLGTLAEAVLRAGCTNPAVIIIGGVAALGEVPENVAALLPAAVR
ncbi:uroporphyrinogen-III C-methyltransferase [Paeniglutamicibacter sp. Y32M11]|uniref:uroporphyrinogen-III C-methyltransferase n=1 Tax=Paeniglutamicibacter sp. Y32M11 TaxID=2853258 RepID=UPI001C5309CD|nr:uroporphyrinogen-III C-methyltransferase [Paeniglutamicibacter sp. Y32M11]QXQ09664.1 uroporphyrinogen-III C-methyltransferase [Paeniglutamicibacter sp. Y32M11]